jgi:outer membrane cobalamin receptor
MVTIVAIAGVALLATDLRAQDTAMSKVSLYALSLEDLLKVKISTASLRPQEVQEVPATVYVVTEEDIRAYGYRDLKDVLRNLPGIDYIWPGSHLFVPPVRGPARLPLPVGADQAPDQRPGGERHRG